MPFEIVYSLDLILTDRFSPVLLPDFCALMFLMLEFRFSEASEIIELFWTSLSSMLWFLPCDSSFLA